MKDLEIGGFNLMEVGVILLLVAVGMFLWPRVPVVKNLVKGPAAGA
jgi:hypothetical protein